MKKALVVIAVLAALVLLIPLAAKSLGGACEFGPCEPSMLSR